MEIYCNGGSPCSGKSTVAEAFAQRYGHLIKQLHTKAPPHSGRRSLFT